MIVKSGNKDDLEAAQEAARASLERGKDGAPRRRYAQQSDAGSGTSTFWRLVRAGCAAAIVLNLGYQIQLFVRFGDNPAAMLVAVTAAAAVVVLVLSARLND
jgi:anti-sigma-K factor RskA